MRRRLLFSLAGLALLTSAAIALAADALVMRMEGGAEPPSPVGALRSALAGIADAPEITVEIRDGHAAARAFKAAVRKGEADLASIPMEVLARESALYAVDQIPQLVTTRDGARRLFEVAAGLIARRLSEDDLVLLGLEPRPAIGLLARGQIGGVADLRGKRLWSPGAASRRLAEIAGATPTADMRQADVLMLPAAQALALIRARSLPAGPWTYYRLAGWHPARAVVMASKRLAALPPEVRQRLKGSGPASAEMWWREEAAGTAAAETALADAGHKVEPPSPQLVADLARIGQQMAAEWRPGAGADGAALLDAVRDTAAAPAAATTPAAR